jgi:hypothetical protein
LFVQHFKLHRTIQSVQEKVPEPAAEAETKTPVEDLA